MKIFRKIWLLLFTGSLLFMTVNDTLLAQQNNIKAVIQKAQKSGIDKSALTKLQQQASAQGISEEQLIEIIQPAIDMIGQNLPADFVIHKALEGLSKNIPASSIAPVLQRINKTVAEAAKIVDPWLESPGVKKMFSNSKNGMPEEKFRNELTKVTSKALNHNIGRETAKEIFEQMGNESVLDKTSPANIISAISILPNMSQRVDQSQSVKFVVRALKAGFNANELHSLPFAMSMAQQQRELPASSVIDGISKQFKGGVHAKHRLQNLFNEQIGGRSLGTIPMGLNNQSNQGNHRNNRNS